MDVEEMILKHSWKTFHHFDWKPRKRFNLFKISPQGHHQKMERRRRKSSSYEQSIIVLFPTISSLFCFFLLLFIGENVLLKSHKRKIVASVIIFPLKNGENKRRKMSDDEDIKSVSSLLSATP